LPKRYCLERGKAQAPCSDVTLIAPALGIAEGNSWAAAGALASSGRERLNPHGVRSLPHREPWRLEGRRAEAHGHVFGHVQQKGL